MFISKVEALVKIIGLVSRLVEAKRRADAVESGIV